MQNSNLHIDEIIKDPDFKIRQPIADGFLNMSITPEYLERYYDYLAENVPETSEEIAKVRAYLAGNELEKAPILDNDLGKLVWGSALICEICSIAKKSRESQAPAEPITQSAIWKFISSSPDMVAFAFSLIRKVERQANGIMDLDFYMTEGDYPGINFFFCHEPKFINTDMPWLMLLGDLISRTGLYHEIAHAEGTKHEPKSLVELRDQIMTAMQERRGKFEIEEIGQVAELFAKSAEIKLRHRFFDGLENNFANEHQLKVTGLKREINVLRALVLQEEFRVKGFDKDENRKLDPQRDLSPEEKAVNTVYKILDLTWYQRNGLFNDTPEEWKIMGVDFNDLIAVKDGEVLPPEDAYQILREAAIAAQETISSRDIFEEKRQGKYSEQTQISSKKRAEICEELYPIFLEPFLDKLKEAQKEQIQEQLESIVNRAKNPSPKQQNEEKDDKSGQEKSEAKEHNNDDQSPQDKGQENTDNSGDPEKDKDGDDNDSGQEQENGEGEEAGEGEAQQPGDGEQAGGAGSPGDSNSTSENQQAGEGDSPGEGGSPSSEPSQNSGEGNGESNGEGQPSSESQQPNDAPQGGNSKGSGVVINVPGVGEVQIGDLPEAVGRDQHRPDQKPNATGEEALKKAESDARNSGKRVKRKGSDVDKPSDQNSKDKGQGFSNSRSAPNLGDIADWNYYTSQVAPEIRVFQKLWKELLEKQKAILPPEKDGHQLLSRRMQDYDPRKGLRTWAKTVTGGDITRDDWRLYHRTQPSEDFATIDLFLAVDASGSMYPSPMDGVVATAVAFYESIQREPIVKDFINQYMQIWGDSTPLTLIDPKSTPEEIKERVLGLQDSHGWGTYLSASLVAFNGFFAESYVNSIKKKDSRTGGTHLVILSDGETGRSDGLELLRIMLQENEKLTVDIIPFGNVGTELSVVAKSLKEEFGNRVGYHEGVPVNIAMQEVTKLVKERVKNTPVELTRTTAEEKQKIFKNLQPKLESSYERL